MTKPQTLSAVALTAETAAAAIIASAEAQIITHQRETAALEARTSDDVAFVQSAKTVWAVQCAGVKDLDILAALLKAGVERGVLAEKVSAKTGKVTYEKSAGVRSIYTTPTMVGVHGRTGRLLGLDGPMPKDANDLEITGEGIQRKVFEAPVRPVVGHDEIETVDEILSSATTKAEAYARILAAIEANDARKAASKTDDTDEDDAPVKDDKGTITLAKRFAAMAGNWGKIMESDPSSEEWAEALPLLQAMISQGFECEANVLRVTAEQDATDALDDEIGDALSDSADEDDESLAA